MKAAVPALLLAGWLAALPLGAAEDSPAPDRPAAADENDFALNPTGGVVRTEGMDKWGGGEYLSRRNDPENRGLDIHHGVDLVGGVGQPVIAPIAGRLRRMGEGINTGAEIVGRIRGSRYKVRLVHFTVTVPDGPVNQGQVIGKVKDISRTYKGMTPHVHMETHEWRDPFGYRAKDPSIVLKPLDDATAQRSE